MDKNKFTGEKKVVESYEAPWHVLDAHPTCCRFELVDYDVAAKEEFNKNLRQDTINFHVAKLSAERYKYLKQTYIRVYAFI